MASERSVTGQSDHKPALTQQMAFERSVTDQSDHKHAFTQRTASERSETGQSDHKPTLTQWWILAWRIPWTEEPGGLQSMGS